MPSVFAPITCTKSFTEKYLQLSDADKTKYWIAIYYLLLIFI